MTGCSCLGCLLQGASRESVLGSCIIKLMPPSPHPEQIQLYSAPAYISPFTSISHLFVVLPAGMARRGQSIPGSCHFLLLLLTSNTMHLPLDPSPGSICSPHLASLLSIWQSWNLLLLFSFFFSVSSSSSFFFIPILSLIGQTYIVYPSHHLVLRSLQFFFLTPV